MKVFDKRRAKRASSEDQADFYEYAVMSEELRHKIFFIMERSLSPTSSSLRDPFYFESGSQVQGGTGLFMKLLIGKAPFLLQVEKRVVK